MDKKNIPLLCGGTFFTLLLQAAKQELNERKGWGKSGEFTEGDVLASLIRVAVPTYEKPAESDNFKSVVSAYKACNISKSKLLPICEQANMTTFNNRIKNEYRLPLKAMTTLTEKYIDIDGKAEWLLKALLELLSKDESICGTDALFVCEEGSSITKSELCTLTTVCLPAFLLGIWHYIIINRTDNLIGKATYDDWCKPGKSKNTRQPFQSNIGDSIKQSITLTSPRLSDAEKDPAQNVEDDEDEPSIDFEEPYAAEPDPAPNTINQTINATTMFFNKGANVNQINNTGTIYFDRGDRR